MTRKLLLILTFIATGLSLSAQTPAVDSIYSENIKTVILGKQGVEMSLPIIQLGSNERLMLRFDELGDNSNYYRYRIDHCTHNWQISDISASDYMNGFEDGAIDNQQFSFTTIEHYTNYWQTIPNDMSSFAASGNYLLTVYLQSDPDSIVFTRRFKVFEPLTVVEATVGRVQGSVGLMENQNLSVKVNPLEGNYFINPDAYMYVYAEQNGRKDLTRLLPLESMSGNTLNYRWKKENVFPGGNEFRFFDFSNLQFPMNNVWKIEYFGGENIVFLKPDENRSRNVYIFQEGLNGQYKIAAVNIQNPNTEADYAWVNFSLPQELPFLDGSVYIVGDFTNWKLDDNTRMEWNEEMKAYIARLFLKQGYYSYHLLFLPAGSKVGETSRLEGNHFQTTNDYYIYVYQRMPGDLYDRLVGFGQTQANR